MLDYSMSSVFLAARNHKNIAIQNKKPKKRLDKALNICYINKAFKLMNLDN